jgi:hypothetical protein
MKTLIFALVVLCGQSAFANSMHVPTDFLAVKPAVSKSMNVNTSTNEEFAQNVDHLMDVQQQSLENLNTEHAKVSLTQLLTSFTVSKTGLFGLSSLSSSSNTTLFWNKKKVAATKNDEAKIFEINADEDELSLQMKIDDVTEYLVRNGKVKDASKLRDNLDKVMRKAHGIFNDVANLETPNWRVGGYRLDLAIAGSGKVTPFTKVGENVRLWIEWTRPAHKTAVAPANTKVTRFVSKVLNDTEQATLNVKLPNFELANVSVAVGEDLKAGLFGFGSSTFGFVGHVKFVKKPKTTKALLVENTESDDEAYPVIQDQTNEKSMSRAVSISSKKIKQGIEKSMHFAEFFAAKAESIESTHWELGQIREIATVTQAGLFGLSTLSTKGVFTFVFNRIQPQAAALTEAAPTPTTNYVSLIRLSFVTVLGIQIPAIANFELHPNVELFWK